MPQPITINCPTCAGAMAVTDDYLAQYGGQASTCPACRAPFTVPTLQPAAPAMIGYANPYAPRGSSFYDGVGLVMAKGASTPDRCVKCNAPAMGYRWSKTFYWHNPALYFLVCAGILVYAIVALVVRKSGRVSVALCPEHRAKRGRHITIAWVLALVGVGMIVFGGYMGNSDMPRDERGTYVAIGVLGGLVALLVGVIWGAVAAPVVTPRKIDDQYVYLKSAGEPFLRSLPEHFI